MKLFFFWNWKILIQIHVAMSYNFLFFGKTEILHYKFCKIKLVYPDSLNRQVTQHHLSGLQMVNTFWQQQPLQGSRKEMGE